MSHPKYLALSLGLFGVDNLSNAEISESILFLERYLIVDSSIFYAYFSIIGL